ETGRLQKASHVREPVDHSTTRLIRELEMRIPCSVRVIRDRPGHPPKELSVTDGEEPSPIEREPEHHPEPLWRQIIGEDLHGTEPPRPGNAKATLQQGRPIPCVPSPDLVCSYSKQLETLPPLRLDRRRDVGGALVSILEHGFEVGRPRQQRRPRLV